MPNPLPSPALHQVVVDQKDQAWVDGKKIDAVTDGKKVLSVSYEVKNSDGSGRLFVAEVGADNKFIGEMDATDLEAGLPVTSEYESDAKISDATSGADVAIKIVTTMVSLGIVMPVVASSKTCVASEVCGQFLGPLNQRELFLFGGMANGVAGNILFSFTSAPEMVRFFLKQNKKTKLAILTFVVSQMMQEFFVSEGTNSTEWATLLAMLGAIPGAIFTFQHFKKSRWGVSWLRQKEHALRLMLSPIWALTTDFEKNLQYYAVLQKAWIAKLEASFAALMDQLGTDQFPTRAQFLAKQKIKRMQLWLHRSEGVTQESLIKFCAKKLVIFSQTLTCCKIRFELAEIALTR